MKYINKYKSPNYNSRKKSKINLIIIHYTALSDKKKAINYLCDKKRKVSSHYLISQDGELYCLVKENNRAWHAGVSQWQNIKDVNSKSIGIELDYSINKKNNFFSSKMINTLMILLLKLKKKYKIDNRSILGHSDIAPYRKIDPGPNFPWDILVDKDLIFRINDIDKNLKFIVLKWFKYRKINSFKQKAIFILAYIGYDTSQALNNKVLFEKLILVYKIRYLKSMQLTQTNPQVLNTMINHFINLILTE